MHGIGCASQPGERHGQTEQGRRINAGIRSTIEQLANGSTDAATQSELFRNYLKASAAFWDYSWHNQMLIWKQKPDASYVGGFNTWLKCGRYVRKGEKGIAILAPMFFKDKNAAGDDTKRIWFKVVYVFDLGQTDGTPLPELPLALLEIVAKTCWRGYSALPSLAASLFILWRSVA